MNLDDITSLRLDQLVLDSRNPRLASQLLSEPTQDELIDLLWTHMAVDEVALSIAENGFYQTEPLLVIPDPPDHGADAAKFTVVEGNRRLAAVLILVDDATRERVRATDLPHLTEEAKGRLHVLPVIAYPNRESLWAYLGFRHINGTKPWDAFSKAQYVAQVHEDYSVPLLEIARRIGDRHATVERLYRGYIVLRQAERETAFDRGDRVQKRFYFSHLYTAISQSEFQRFLGIDDESWAEPNPVPADRLENLAELMTWLFGRRSTRTEPVVQTQFPDLNYLRSALGNPSSVAALRSGFTLASAYEISLGDTRRFRDALVAAKEELQDAKGTVTTGYNGERDLADMIDDISRVVASIKREMDEYKKR